MLSSEMQRWTKCIAQQRAICSKFGAEYLPLDLDLKIGLARNVLTSLNPINGLRNPVENGTCGWYIWAGLEFSEDADFFQPYCVAHLLELKPQILPYLGLPPGYRFLVDVKGYEDVWADESLIF